MNSILRKIKRNVFNFHTGEHIGTTSLACNPACRKPYIVTLTLNGVTTQRSYSDFKRATCAYRGSYQSRQGVKQ